MAQLINLKGSYVNKKELIKVVAEKSGISQKDTGAVLDAFIENVTAALKANDNVSLIGFGAFEVVERAARTGQNPKTGEKIQIAASISPKFRAGKALKDAVSDIKSEAVTKVGSESNNKKASKKK